MRSREEELETNLREVQGEIASFNPTLIVVTKTYPVSDVEILHGLGVGNFGENRSSEGIEKSAAVDGTWHYQGEIQSKKIREILSWADCIHSLDSQSHPEKISRTLQESQSRVDLFLQLSLDGDPNRGGLQEAELFSLAEKVSVITEINLLGIMSVPPVNIEPKSAFKEIGAIHQRFIALFPTAPSLSAGMSGDYMLALEHGATHIRVGSKILGARSYR
jgi:pyridoxal phosphate enzyme (YggS family)